MFKNQDIIIVSLQPWDINLGSNSKDIAIELAKNNRVLYVNEPLNTRSKIFRKESVYVSSRIQMLNHENGGLMKKKDGLIVFYPQITIPSINFIPSKRIFNALNKKNNELFASEIDRAAKQLKFREYILIIDSSIFNGFYLKELLNPKALIYYLRDNLVIQPYFKRHGARLEPELIKKADLVATNSNEHIEYAARFNAKSCNIGQGSDISIFDFHRDDLKVPREIENLPGPIIGYEGFLCSFRLDTCLIKYLAEKRPNWQFVFVGPMDNEFTQSGFEQFPNIHLIGWKDLQTLPNYILSFDVCINPQLVNQHTWGNNPRKIMEYLAMGKPVVATHTKAMENFKDVCLLAKSPAEYLSQIEAALNNKQDKKEIFRNYAKKNGWEKSVRMLWEALNESIHPEYSVEEIASKESFNNELTKGHNAWTGKCHKEM